MREEQYMILVCGGRDFCERDYMWQILDAYRFLYGKFILIHGSARGADTLAEEWAKSRQQIYIGFPAEWDEYGKAAGTRRNREMLELAHPNLVVAFRGQHGTANMADTTEKLGGIVHKWGWDT